MAPVGVAREGVEWAAAPIQPGAVQVVHVGWPTLPAAHTSQGEPSDDLSPNPPLRRFTLPRQILFSTVDSKYINQRSPKATRRTPKRMKVTCSTSQHPWTVIEVKDYSRPVTMHLISLMSIGVLIFVSKYFCPKTAFCVRATHYYICSNGVYWVNYYIWLYLT